MSSFKDRSQSMKAIDGLYSLESTIVDEFIVNV